MRYTVFFLFSATCFLSCKNNQNPIEENFINIDKQVNAIKTIEEKKQFLNQLYINSQGKVEEIDTLEKNFAKNHTKAHKSRRELDSLRPYNAYKAQKYLEKYSYPTDTITYSKEEFEALYFAFLHSSRVNSLLKGLPYIQKQYEDGKLTARYFLHYLNNIYYLDKTKFYQFDKTHNVDQLVEDILVEIEQIKKSTNP